MFKSHYLLKYMAFLIKYYNFHFRHTRKFNQPLQTVNKGENKNKSVYKESNKLPIVHIFLRLSINI